MRRTAWAMLAVLVVWNGSQSAPAEEPDSKFAWWPFGEEEPAEPPYPTTSTPGETPAERQASWVPTRPQFHMPEFHVPTYDLPTPRMPRPHFGSEKAPVDEARNAWTQTSPEPEQASPWQVVTESAQRLGRSTRNAWNRTVDVLTPSAFKADNEPGHAVAQRDPLWKRILGVESQEPEGPRTVTEWMAQERLDP